MRFEIHGIYQSHRGREPVTLAWEDGEIEAPPALAGEIEARVGVIHQVPGLISAPLDLADPLSVHACFSELLEVPTEQRGDVPRVEPLPPGAIA